MPLKLCQLDANGLHHDKNTSALIQMIEQINQNVSHKNDLLEEKGYGYLPLTLVDGINTTEEIGCKYLSKEPRLYNLGMKKYFNELIKEEKEPWHGRSSSDVEALDKGSYN